MEPFTKRHAGSKVAWGRDGVMAVPAQGSEDFDMVRLPKEHGGLWVPIITSFVTEYEYRDVIVHELAGPIKYCIEDIERSVFLWANPSTTEKGAAA